MSSRAHDDPGTDRLTPVPGDVLGRAECLALLGSAHLGRVGLSVDALPVIVPVGFSVMGDRVVLGAHADRRAVAAIDGAVVAFEADEWDRRTGSGWSVLVQGPAHRLVDRADLVPLTGAAELPSWIAEASEIVVVSTEVISGCRLRARRPVSATAGSATGARR
jgi:hypothetical protein